MKGIIVFLLIVQGKLTFSNELSFKDFLSLSQKNDPEFKRIFSDEKKMKFLIDEGLPSSQFLINISGEKGYSSESNADTLRLSGGIQKEIIQSGTELSITHTKTERPDREEKVTEFRLEQSLYKNFLGSDVRLKREALSEEEKLLYLQMLENYEEYLVSITTTFLDYRKAALDLKLARDIYDEASKLQKNVESKFRSQVASSTDVNRSELLTILREEDLAEKKNLLETQKVSIHKIIGKEGVFPGIKLEQEVLLPFDRKKIDSQETFSEKIRSVEIKKIEESISKKTWKLAERGNRPSLNLVAGYNIDDSERFSTKINREETVIGLNLELPLGDSQGNATKELAKVDLYKAEMSQRVNLLEHRKKYSEYKDLLRTLEKKVSRGKRKTQLVKKILKDEERRYKYGRIDLETLIETKNNYAEYRFQYQSDLIELNKALLNWYAFNDELINKLTPGLVK